jgi:hypothetical protein
MTAVTLSKDKMYAITVDLAESNALDGISGAVGMRTTSEASKGNYLDCNPIFSILGFNANTALTVTLTTKGTDNALFAGTRDITADFGGWSTATLKANWRLYVDITEGTFTGGCTNA